MKYAEVRKLFEMLCEFDPNSMKGIYDEDMFGEFILSYKEILAGLGDYLKFWDFEFKEVKE
jgi:hypothetical protein